ncbi:MAG TPA: DMT family transporter [Deltaproteobacteria bacterium]|nr:DMT family transporter [Deltaproteobacteria bacterium]
MKRSRLQSGGVHVVVYIKLFLTAVLWGGTFIAARVVAQDVGPFSAAFLRFAIASVFLLLILVHVEGKLPRLTMRQCIPVFLLGMTGVFAYNFFFFSGLKTITASRASLIIATNPVMIALCAALFFRERLHVIHSVGIALCASGALVVISRGNPLMLFQGGLGVGELNILGCVASWVAYSLIGKVAMKDMSPLAAVTYSCVVGALTLSYPAYLEGIIHSIGHYDGVEWFGIFYLGFFGSVLGFTWYYEGIQAIGASRAGVFINFVPVSAVILAFFILRETIDPSLVVGAAMVIGGAYLTNTRQPLTT